MRQDTRRLVWAIDSELKSRKLYSQYIDRKYDQDDGDANVYGSISPITSYLKLSGLSLCIASINYCSLWPSIWHPITIATTYQGHCSGNMSATATKNEFNNIKIINPPIQPITCQDVPTYISIPDPAHNPTAWFFPSALLEVELRSHIRVP